uniref:Large ribosomal subunit protein uL22c n=1 Tax=Kewa sp. GY-2019 TaxID=2518615 RepID=A0A411K482_9CARY|nr:ribosomal protein L22 [Kewa sp. GY-2019]QBC72140.1 ribosomal protein L22 [Kewa sp. GY-2019]
MRKNKRKLNDEVYALGQYIPMSADKARRVIDQIRGRSYLETLMILGFMPYRACYPILKLISSAAANGSHNQGFNKVRLIISKAEVNKGTTMKKLKPRARGRSYPIKRPTCHITIVLRDKSVEEEYIKEIIRKAEEAERKNDKELGELLDRFSVEERKTVIRMIPPELRVDTLAILTPENTEKLFVGFGMSNKPLRWLANLNPEEKRMALGFLTDCSVEALEELWDKK